MKTLAVAFGLIAAVSAGFLSQEWQGFKESFGKQYSNLREEHLRFQLYLQNKDLIQEHNEKYEKGLVSFSMKMNEFGDLSADEFVSQHLGCLKVPGEVKGAEFIAPAAAEDLPDTVDWRTEGVVTPVKNQGFCGSCWAFSASGALEGHNFRKSGKLVGLSEQNLVDCAYGSKYDCFGCNGGFMDGAFLYVKENSGIDTEKSYPYIGRNGKCKFNNSTIGGTSSGIVKIPEGNETKLAEALATAGPVAIGIHATATFQFYSKGVLNDPSCTSYALNHGVLAVGYGVEKGQEYWLVKNSWGRGWGDEGYVKMSKNKKNQCGVASMASYPLV